MDSNDAIVCPRCAKPMESYARKLEGNREIIADMCLECGGCWLDGAEVAAVYPAFSNLTDRLATVPEPAEPARHISRCPRCGAKPKGFAFFEIDLDACLECHGLWVDGDEITDLARTADRQDGLPAPEPLRADYRSNAATACRSGTVICKGCNARIPLEAAEMTGVGPMCSDCADRRRANQLDQEFANYKPPMRSIFGGEGAGALLGAFGALFKGLVSGIAGLDHSARRCPRCGCRERSRCRH